MAVSFRSAIAATLFAFASSVVLPSVTLAMDDAQKAEMGAFIKQYLLDNPEILIEVQQALEKKQNDQRVAQAGKAIAENHDAIFADANDIVIGNPKGSVAVVEFFDYNCGYCKRALPDMDAIVAANDDVRFILKEFPILGPDSVAAHRVAGAFKALAPEKYAQFHRALLGGQDHASEATALQVAESLGVKEADIRAKMDTITAEQEFKPVYELANSLGVTGTPSYIMGNEAVYGAVGAAALSEKVANIRSCGKATC